MTAMNGSKAHQETALLLDALTVTPVTPVTPETLAAIPEYACPCCGALHAGGGTKTTVRCPCGLTIHFQCRHEKKERP